MTPPLIAATSPVTDSALIAIAHMPTRSLPALVEAGFLRKLTDKDFVRIAFHLARKSYAEGGCPIGAVIVDDSTHEIVGKGHNTLVQEDHPYNHGETSAIRDAGRRNFRGATMFTSLSPCDICAALIHMRGFGRAVVGDVTNFSGNEETLREKGLRVDILEDRDTIELYARFRNEKPELCVEDWKGVAGNEPPPSSQR